MNETYELEVVVRLRVVGRLRVIVRLRVVVRLGVVFAVSDILISCFGALDYEIRS